MHAFLASKMKKTNTNMRHKNSTILLYLVTVHLDNEVVQPPLEVHGLGDCGGDGGLQVWHRQASRVT